MSGHVCIGVTCAIPCLLFTAATIGFMMDEVGHISPMSYLSHKVTPIEMGTAPTSSGYLAPRKLPRECVLFLYNGSTPRARPERRHHQPARGVASPLTQLAPTGRSASRARLADHVEFLHDMQVAHTHHKEIDFVKADCERQKTLCASLGHADVHEYEPALMFYHNGEWTESFHDDIQTGKRPPPTSRRDRVREVLKWVDAHRPNAGRAILERENRWAEMRHTGSPAMQKMREMRRQAMGKNRKDQEEL